LQRDTFCHHFGSITLGESQRKNNTLEKSRKLFLDKYGFDPWGNGFCYDIEVLNAFGCKLQGLVKILGIDAGIGSTPLQVKNELRHNGNREALLYSFTTDKLFEPDLKPYSDHFAYDMIENLEAYYEGTQFDYIYIGKMLEEYPDAESLMRSLKKLLKKNGQMICKISNPYSVSALYELSLFRMPGGEKRIQRLDPFWLNAFLSNMYAECRIIATKDDIHSQLTDYYRYIYKLSNGFANAEVFLKAAAFYFALKG
jgi:SAM-dependent methyltransferase